ncbi:1357_t:CDS:2 [Diversispora eburnea]|uniref:1357_t:CDS:1 n=1 Tax=Diversispora eburnea TaxID=1213867 RepID=A0A9N8YMU7_9GLOM|nr:1357_t:CDS:2 [Diversispora eburnea]
MSTINALSTPPPSPPSIFTNNKISTKIISSINPNFSVDILADNAREYTVTSDQSFLGLFDVYAFVFTLAIGLMVSNCLEAGISIDDKLRNKDKISNIVINEGITILQVKFYMAILVEEADRMHLLPKLNVLLQVYQGTRSIIFNEMEEDSLFYNINNIQQYSQY